jgi:two-component system, NtrC family, sensor histidine kinase HydH
MQGAATLPLPRVRSRFGWLVALRVALLSLMLGLSGFLYLRSGVHSVSYSLRVLLSTLAAGYLVAAACFLAMRRDFHLDQLAYVEIVFDQAAWSALIYVTGGATSGATALYGLTCLAGAVLIGPRGPLVAAVAGALFYVLMCAGFVTGWLRAPPDQPASSYVTAGEQVFYPLVINLLVLLVVMLLAEYLAERLQVAGGRIEEATQRAEDAERLAALGRIAAGLAHEIRNPLGSIVGSVQLLSSAEGLGTEARQLCGIVERETARLNDLVDDMLQLARPKRPVIGEVDVGRTAREVVSLASQSGRGKDVLVRYEGPVEGESLLTQADGGQLRQVMWNLVRNAVQASHPGAKVKVRVAKSDPGSRKAGWSLEVHDDGPGITSEARSRLFEPFFTTRTSGMGIGLAVVKRIVDDHGWSIEVRSDEGRGATFRVLG